MIPSHAMLAETITDPAAQPGQWLRSWWVDDYDNMPHGDLRRQAADERAARRLAEASA